MAEQEDWSLLVLAPQVWICAFCSCHESAVVVSVRRMECANTFMCANVTHDVGMVEPPCP